MNKINQNGISVTQTENSIIFNGTEYPIPEKVRSKRNTIIVLNGKVIVNGFIFNQKTGEFKRPFPIFWVLVVLGIIYYIFKNGLQLWEIIAFLG